MRKLFAILFAMLMSVSAMAQLEVKEGSFKEVIGFVNINADPNYQTDDNNLPFAVIKIRTENISDKQRRELKISGNAGTFIMLEYMDGEVWVYLTAKYADYLKISHPDFSSVEFSLPMDLIPKKGYEMTLINKSLLDKKNYLIVKTDKQDAKIYIDDKYIGNGYASKVVSIGEEHRYRVSCDDYYPKEGLVYFDKREDKEINIILELSFAYITIKSEPSGADVYIDEIKVGNTPYNVKKIKLGQHSIELRKYGYESVADIITITKGDHNKQFENVQLVEDKSILQQSLTKTNETIEQSSGNKRSLLDEPLISSKVPLESSHSSVNSSITQDVGVFSVSDTKIVSFSKGNLQYQASTKSWRFAEHQWDIIGSQNGNISLYYSGWIDLFGWGTGNNPTTISASDSYYNSFYDWGDNMILNGNGKSWRTLTKDEWVYVLTKRKTSSGIRYVKATVNGINGLIILPDNWISSFYNLINTDCSWANYNSNHISQFDWSNKFEVNGAVFLPAAGNRVGNKVDDVYSCGFYWSSTSKSGGNGMFRVLFTEYNVVSDNCDSAKYGRSVRLVRDIE